MEITCTRCHQAVQAENCYCPVCGLPQLAYSADGAAGPGQPERWTEVVRDAGSVDWKPALRSALMLAVPAGLLCSHAFAGEHLRVALDGRNRRLGGGALYSQPATGVDHHWRGRAHRPGYRRAGRLDRRCRLRHHAFAMRFWFHQGKFYDNLWQNLVNQQMSQQWTSMGVDAQTIALMKAWLLSPEGRAGWAAVRRLRF